MNYEIPADTARILNESKAIALRYGFIEITSLCLLRSTLDVPFKSTERLKEMNTDMDAIRQKVDDMLANSEQLHAAPERDFIPPFDTECTRIINC